MASAASEMVDVIDEDGRTVAVVTRAEMRLRRLPHRCTYVLVFDGAGRLFVHQRTATKDVYPSHHDVAIGGVLLAGESFAQGTRREVREELGIEAEAEELFPFRYRDDATMVHALVYRLVHDGPFRLQPEEIVGGAFLSDVEIAELMARVPFCPDGLQVLATYRARSLRQ